MLTVRLDQLETMRRARRRLFEDRLVSHLQRCFRAEVAAMGDAAVRDLVTSGVERALRAGFATQRGICSFVDLMLVLGPEVAAVEHVPWARVILSGMAQRGEAATIDLLHRAAALGTMQAGGVA